MSTSEDHVDNWTWSGQGKVDHLHMNKVDKWLQFHHQLYPI